MMMIIIITKAYKLTLLQLIGDETVELDHSVYRLEDEDDSRVNTSTDETDNVESTSKQSGRGKRERRKRGEGEIEERGGREG